MPSILQVPRHNGARGKGSTAYNASRMDRGTGGSTMYSVYPEGFLGQQAGLETRHDHVFISARSPR
jgi:hypothetical protein